MVPPPSQAFAAAGAAAFLDDLAFFCFGAFAFLGFAAAAFLGECAFFGLLAFAFFGEPVYGLILDN